MLVTTPWSQKCGMIQIPGNSSTSIPPYPQLLVIASYPLWLFFTSQKLEHHQLNHRKFIIFVPWLPVRKVLVITRGLILPWYLPRFHQIPWVGPNFSKLRNGRRGRVLPEPVRDRNLLWCSGWWQCDSQGALFVLKGCLGQGLPSM